MMTTAQPVSVRILADDLTGACDAAVAFACVGLSTEVETSWNLKGLSRSPVLACNTESRDSSSSQLTGRIAEVVRRFRDEPAHHLFKKIDSVFRGNTFTEIIEITSAFPHELAILAPAFPELGRKVVNGELLYWDVAGSHRLSVADGLRRAGASATLVPDPSRIALDQAILLCDSATPEDLSAIVTSAMSLAASRRLLWIGSGGLAHALAQALAPIQQASAITVTGSKVLFLVGSDHPVTLAQLKHLKLSEPGATIITIPRNLTSQQLYSLVAPHLTTDVSCLFATGGDTALAVCRALRIDRLELHSEFSRGLPQARILDGPMKGTAFLLKSGGFGDESVLSRIAQTFSNQETSSVR